MDRALSSMLSLCQRAGKLVSGEDTVEINLKKGSLFIVIIAADASENTKNKFLSKCKHYNTRCCIFSSRDELSRAAGRYNRTVFGITDKNFADKISSLLTAQSVN